MALQTSFIIANTKGECVKNMPAILLNIMKINEDWGCQTPKWQKKAQQKFYKYNS